MLKDPFIGLTPMHFIAIFSPHHGHEVYSGWSFSPTCERITDSPFQSTYICCLSRLFFTGEAVIFFFMILKALFLFFVVVFFMESVTAAVEGRTTWDETSANGHGEEEEHTCLFILRNWALKQGNRSDKCQVALDHSLQENLDIDK